MEEALAAIQKLAKESKVVSLTPPPIGVDISPLGRHNLTLRHTAEKIFGEELLFPEDLLDKLPLLKWTKCEQVPGVFLLYLLSSASRSREMHFLLHEMVSYWLVTEEPLQILSSRNSTFQVPGARRPFYFIELLIHIEKDKQLQMVERHLPKLIDEIKLSSFTKGYAGHLGRLSAPGKMSYIYERIVALMRRYPARFDQDVFRQLQLFQVHSRDEFRDIRDAKDLCRVICFHYLSQKSIRKEIKTNPDRRHLYFKLLKTELRYTFGLKKVMGIAIALNSLREYEYFEERHVLKAIQKILPDVKAVPDSFYSNRNEESKVLTIYFEFEKRSSEPFTLNELLGLRKKLSNELKNSIEYLTPSLFIPRNEEEIYRNIIILSQELKYVHDLPQAIISFQEQKNDVLKFNVILLRVLKNKTPALQELAKNLSEERFIQEKVTKIGFLRKKYVKEANLFSLEIASKLFLRKNHSVDLIKARQFVVKSIEKMLGQFRDYNGGFLLKQNQQLESIKTRLGEEGKQNELLIENLFYSLTPSIIQTILSPQAGHALCSLFLKILDSPLYIQNKYTFEKEEGPGFLAVIIKVKQSDIKEKLGDALKDLNIDPLKCGSGLIEFDGYYYICYLYLHPEKEESSLFLKVIDETLATWLKKQLNLQIIHLQLPRATQSLDPRIGADRTSGIVIRMLYEGLMRIGVDNKVELAIARDVTISPDGIKYLFKLKKTFWSNGLPLTAHDFAFAWKKILEPQLNSPYAFLFFIIKNARRVKYGELPIEEVGINVVDDETLLVELEYPASYFLGLTAHWTYSPLSHEIDQRHPGWAYQSASSHISNGPFKLDVWKLNDDLELIKNPLYWEADSVRLRKIKISIVEDPVAQEMFERGEIHWFGDPMTQFSTSLASNLKKRGILESAPISGFFWLQLNINQKIFSNPALRKAFAIAINRKKLIEKTLDSDDQAALTFYYAPHLELSPRFQDGDETLAKQLFEEGLLEINMKKEDLPPIIFTHSNIDQHIEISHAVGKVWEEVLGVKVKYERIAWNDYFAALNRSDYMVGGMSWYSRYEDPLYYLDIMINRGESLCITKWKNAEFIELIEKAKRESLPEERMRLSFEAEKIAIDEMPLIPIYFNKWRFIKSPRLKDAILSSMGQIDFRRAYLENES